MSLGVSVMSAGSSGFGAALVGSSAGLVVFLTFDGAAVLSGGAWNIISAEASESLAEQPLIITAATTSAHISTLTSSCDFSLALLFFILPLLCFFYIYMRAARKII